MSSRAEQRALEALPPRYRKSKDGTTKIDSVLPVRKLYIRAYEQAEKDLGWHSVEESVPEIDEEVIVLRNEHNGTVLPFPYYLTYGHLVSDKSIFVEYNGWNVPGVHHWMPCPKIPKED